MNQRMLQLAASHFPRDGEGNICATPDIIAEFAELIVRQCIGMVLPYNEEDPCAERLYELADTIGEHFGVEE